MNLENLVFLCFHTHSSESWGEDGRVITSEKNVSYEHGEKRPKAVQSHTVGLQVHEVQSRYTYGK